MAAAKLSIPQMCAEIGKSNNAVIGWCYRNGVSLSDKKKGKIKPRVRDRKKLQLQEPPKDPAKSKCKHILYSDVCCGNDVDDNGLYCYECAQLNDEGRWK